MDKAPFFSIVLPVYGVEAYLKDALDSILGQAFQDFEILLVNDASPDNSKEICEEYAAKYPFITLLNHKENQGLSAARNTGLAHANGQYIWFMDSDDCIQGELLTPIYRSLCDHPADILTFGLTEDYYDAHGNITQSVVIAPTAGNYREPDALHRQIFDLESKNLYGYAWNKFYSLAYLREHALQFEKIVLIEDIVFNVEFCQNITAMNCLDLTVYHYAKRGTSSLTAAFVPEYYKVHRQRIDMLYEQAKSWHCDNETVKSLLASLYVRYIFSAISRNCDKRAHMSHTDRKRWLEKVFADGLFCELISFAGAQSLAIRVMIALLQKRQLFGSLVFGRMLYIVQTYLKNTFNKLKQARG